MEVGKIFSIAMAIVVVAGITVVTASPNTQGDLRAVGDTFSGSLKAAMGH